MLPVEPEAIAVAAARIAAHVRRTPTIDIDPAALGLEHDTPLSLKLELLQVAASFKARGAFNNLLSRAIPPAGVAAASGGNHGLAVATAAVRLGIPARIFIPETSSPVKQGALRATGVDLVVEGLRYADAQERCDAYLSRSGAASLHPYDMVETVAGQGTVALEWEAQAPDLDTVLVAVGGGGLIAGIAAWYGERVKTVAVEPEGSCCLHAAREAGKPVDVSVDSIAGDSLGAKRIGAIPFAIAQARVAEAVLVSDSAIVEAQRRLWRVARIAAEPGGATALAALLCGAYRPGRGERVGILICGGNVDPASLA